ncbi:amidohydrolase family protein [Microbulbifer sp. S227A]|uniref:amidohydrolase family protein n=1 Tax=Microbulbifer sp. S227A TaxID=3415131 RepID=UPI003C7A3126
MPGTIVDAHHHLWELERFPYSWLAPDAPPRPFGNHDAIKRDFLTSNYLEHFEGLPLAASVHIDANCGAAEPGDETAWLADLSGRSGWPHAAVGGIDLLSRTVADTLQAHARHPIARGVRAMVAHDRTGRWCFSDRAHVLSDPTFIKNAGLLSEMGFSLDLVIVPEQLAEVAGLAETLPNLSIIVDHLATPETSSLSEWRNGMEMISRFDNIAMKLSGLWIIDKHWRVERLRPYVHHALDQIGGDRLMYGSNAPIDTLHCSVVDQISGLALLIGEKHPQGIDAVFSDTARRVYRFGPPINNR